MWQKQDRVFKIDLFSTSMDTTIIISESTCKPYTSAGPWWCSCIKGIRHAKTILMLSVFFCILLWKVLNLFVSKTKRSIGCRYGQIIKTRFSISHHKQAVCDTRFSINIPTILDSLFVLQCVFCLVYIYKTFVCSGLLYLFTSLSLVYLLLYGVWIYTYIMYVEINPAVVYYLGTGTNNQTDCGLIKCSC